MSLLDFPWARIKQPVTIPARLSPTILSEMDADAFGELVLCHLNPNYDRAGWRRLWDAIQADDELADRTFDMVQDWADLAHDTLDSPEADETAQRRIPAFLKTVESVLNRLDRAPRDDLPLAWAGDAGDYNMKARTTIAALVSAIAAHRGRIIHQGDIRAADRKLWAALRKVGLDPSEYPSTDFPEDLSPLTR